MLDLSQKILRSEDTIAGKGKLSMSSGKGSASSAAETAVQKVVKESNRITSEEIAGFLSNVIKERVFLPSIQAPQPL